MGRPALFVFAKQPQPGAVKTRLLPDYSPAQAAEIAALCLRATAALVASAWPGPRYLCGAPDIDHPLFRELAHAHGLVLAPQAAGDLGVRMEAALRAGVAAHGAAAVLGTDVPHCPRAVIGRAYRWLASGRAVVGPAEDGGYYLIGLSSPAPALFGAIDWGGEQVLAQTQARAAQLGIELLELPRLRDLDTAADLRCIARQFAPLRPYC